MSSHSKERRCSRSRFSSSSSESRSRSFKRSHNRKYSYSRSRSRSRNRSRNGSRSSNRSTRSRDRSRVRCRIKHKSRRKSRLKSRSRSRSRSRSKSFSPSSSYRSYYKNKNSSKHQSKSRSSSSAKSDTPKIIKNQKHSRAKSPHNKLITQNPPNNKQTPETHNSLKINANIIESKDETKDNLVAELNSINSKSNKKNPLILLHTNNCGKQEIDTKSNSNHKKTKTILKSNFPSTVKGTYYALGYDLALKTYDNAKELLNKHDVFSQQHIRLLQKKCQGNAFRPTKFTNVFVWKLNDYLWLRESKDNKHCNYFYVKSKASSEAEWKLFMSQQNIGLVKQWVWTVVTMKKSKCNIDEDIEMIVDECLPQMYTNKVHQYMTMFVKNIVSNIKQVARKTVLEWNHYAIIYWLNRVNNGRFNSVKYVTLRNHIFIGKVRGDQLCHINSVTLNMIGIYDSDDIELILNLISELIARDNYDNLAANLLFVDNIPISYCDPISFELMMNPCLLKSSDNVYDKKVITEYIREFGKDPLTGKSACVDQIKQRDKLANKIYQWIESNCHIIGAVLV